jgi:hypothetical protein
MYAISIKPSHAVTILRGTRPFHYRSPRTDHRGLLRIHAWKQKTPKGLSASPPGVACNVLLGVVELVDCITAEHPGVDPDEVEYHWVLANPCLRLPPTLRRPHRAVLRLPRSGYYLAGRRAGAREQAEREKSDHPLEMRTS